MRGTPKRTSNFTKYGQSSKANNPEGQKRVCYNHQKPGYQRAERSQVAYRGTRPRTDRTAGKSLFLSRKIDREASGPLASSTSVVNESLIEERVQPVERRCLLCSRTDHMLLRCPFRGGKNLSSEQTTKFTASVWTDPLIGSVDADDFGIQNTKSPSTKKPRLLKLT
ncbi:hypothetical protein CSKR_103866 [Clonorchis sinensis]|uniref:Uncharacterized protein n=1 Tax=Clonorchis sinensis TaxID=79923 RepID=A0A419PQN4_CLOSI|nr:hypothetical protein CSKR_103866 [Clonorchis sinensis]